jgi:hypothetical protein
VPTVNYAITATANDATYAFGTLDNTGVLSGNYFGDSCYPGLRFLAVAVPQGATITSATLTLIVGGAAVGAGTGASLGVWKGVASDNAPAWTTTAPNTGSRTTASVTALGSTTLETSRAHTVTSIVQEIVNRAGWVSGNAMAFAGDPTGATHYCGFYDYVDNTSKAATLSITYASGGGGTGTAALTEAADTSSATGKLAIAATFAKNEAADTASATGKIAIRATLAATEAADTASSTGRLSIAASSGLTESADTLVASGALLASIAGAAALTESADTVTSAGALAIAGSASLTEAGDTAGATGSLAISATLSVTEQADTLSAMTEHDAEELPIGVGEVSALEEVDTVAATGQLAIHGTIEGAEETDTVAATGVLRLVGRLDVTEQADTLAAVIVRRVPAPTPPSRSTTASSRLPFSLSSPRRTTAATRRVA